MDREDAGGITETTQNSILKYLKDNINNFDAVVLSDYCKGVFENPEFVQNIISICNEHGVIIAIDSKSRNISAFKNADFVKPNNLELENAVDVKIVDDESFDRAGEMYLTISQAKSIIVTRGAAGISFLSDRLYQHIQTFFLHINCTVYMQKQYIADRFSSENQSAFSMSERR